MTTLLCLLLTLLFSLSGPAMGNFGDFSRCLLAAKAPDAPLGPVQGPSPKIHTGAQGKHIPGHNNYEEGRSTLSADPSELGRQAGTGQQLGKVEVGLPGSKERVDFGTHIGEHVDPATGVSSPTTKGVIHYGGKGIHIVPARP